MIFESTPSSINPQTNSLLTNLFYIHFTSFIVFFCKMERTNHTSVNYIRIVKQKLHGPNEKDHSRNINNINNNIETNWRIINHTSNKMNIWYWVFNMPSKKLNYGVWFKERLCFMYKCANINYMISSYVLFCEWSYYA